jgi:hypothetical protein
LQPAFFQRNDGPRFTENSRKWDIYFHYGWAEDDEVTIELPQGWVLDRPVVPHNANFGEIGDYQVDVTKTTDGRKLIYRRTFEFGRKGHLLIPASTYPQVKKVFDLVQEQDSYVITLVPDKEPPHDK